jgi:Flp pilus assembly protein TadG
MRRLITHLHRARALHRADGERGAVAVITALSLVVLLGFAAIAIDVGLLYQERAELQSGADAAALAVAQDCAEGKTQCSTPANTAQVMANANATDGAAAVAKAEVQKAAQKVIVQLSTKEQDGAGSLALAIAPVLGIDSATVGASSNARWGGIRSGVARLPIAFDQCEVQFTGTDVVISMDENKNSGACAGAAQGSPGGFGWYKLGKNNNAAPACKQAIGVPNTVYADTGANFPQGCDDVLEELLQSTAGRTLLFPVYGTATGTGTNAEYGLTGWVAFEVKGWSFTGSREHNFPDCGQGKDKCKKGLYGRFVRFVTLDDSFELDPTRPATNGVAVVELTG